MEKEKTTKKEKKEKEMWNSITIGDLCLETTELSMVELMNSVHQLVNEKSMKKYLDLIKKKNNQKDIVSYLG